MHRTNSLPTRMTCRRGRAASGRLLVGLRFEQHPVAGLDVDRDELAGLVAPPGANRDDLALLRLLLGGVGNDDAPGRLLFSVDALDDDTVVKRAELHRCPPK